MFAQVLLEHKRRNPSDLASIIHLKERIVLDQIIREVAGDIIEQEDIWSPNFARGKVKLFYSSILFGIPLEVVVLPVHVQPHQCGESTLITKLLSHKIYCFYLLHVEI